MITKNTWFVYTSEIFGTKETLIASSLPHIEAQELCDEYRRNLEKNCPNEFASYGNVGDDACIAKRFGLI